MASPPSADECSRAIARAVAARQSSAQLDPRNAHFTAAAFAERITGVYSPLREGRDGWWLVGRVIDMFAGLDCEFDVWIKVEPNGNRRLTLRQMIPIPNLPPPVYEDRYFCSRQMCWVSSETGKPIESVK